MKYLFLVASFSQLSPLLYLINRGEKNIYTLDNVKENIGHTFAKKSFNIDVNNIQSINRIVRKYKLDYILSYASDIGIIAQSKIKKNNLQFENSFESINILTNKYLFRSFLDENNIQKQFYYKINLFNKKIIHSAIKDEYPLISKPSIGSGSKGVRIIKNKNDLYLIKDSISFSKNKEVILESYFANSSKQLCGDGYFLNKKLINFSVGDGLLFNTGISHIPYAESFPSSIKKNLIRKTKNKIENILNKLNFKKGPINFDIILIENEPFIIEIGPRNGGNFIPDAIKLSTGVDLVSAFLKTYTSKNYKFKQKERFKKFISSYMIFSKKNGRFFKININSSLNRYIVRKIIFINKDDEVVKISKASDAIGNLLLKFPNKQTQTKIMKNIEKYVTVNLL